jgi:D-sedoheptulose 7-phosphate isomerase
MAKIVFTNGCFDVLHPGHIELLQQARALGDKLIVGINSDRSVRAIKGTSRPIFSEADRRSMLLNLRAVDEVVVFDQQTPEDLIREILPDVLVKGGDWKIDEIVGGQFVKDRGGDVVSIPLVEGYSSTKVIESMQDDRGLSEADRSSEDTISRSLNEHQETLHAVVADMAEAIRSSAELIVKTFRSGKKVLICGNGGSAADAQHLAAEFVGRFETERRSLPSIALTTDTSALTAIGNDYGFDKVFARQVEGLAVEGDCLIAISTSGNSPNVIAAVMEARRKGCSVIGLTGGAGKKLASLADSSILIPAARTARIQEFHITIAHIWCELVDEAFSVDQ